MTRFQLRIVAVLVVAAGCVGPTTLRAADPPLAVPALSSVAPLGIQPNAPAKISLAGSGLADDPQLWTSFPLAKPAEWVKPKDGKPVNSQASFAFQPANDVAPGIYGFRVVTRGGVSNVRLLMIDDLPSATENKDNKSPATAQKLSPPIAVDGIYEAETSDFYRITVKAGERLSIETVARRLGTPLDPVLRLLDAKGRELAFADDDDTAGADARLSYEFREAGEYVVEVRDVRFAGAAASRYRLRIGGFPLLTAPYPAAVQKGATVDVEPVTVDGRSLKPQRVAIPADFAQPVRSLAVSGDKGQGSGFTTFSVSDAVEQLEAEPNDAADQATSIVLQGAVNGRIGTPGDRDYFRFSGKKGNKVRFLGRTRSLGSPTDLYLRLYTKDGKRQLAESDDVGVEEGMLEATLDADGDYLLSVEELIGAGGPGYVYRIECDVDRPRPSLALEADKFDIPKAGIVQAKVTAVRGGLDGEIKFALDGAPEILLSGSIPATKTDGLLTFYIPPSVTPGKPLFLRLRGEAKVGEATVSVPVGTSAALRKSLGVRSSPASLDGVVALGISAPTTDLIALSMKEPRIAAPPGEKKIEFTVGVERKGAAKAIALDLNAYGLPADYKVAAVKLDKDKNEAKITIELPAEAAAKQAKPKELKFVVVGTAIVAKKMAQGSSPELTLALGETPKTKPAAKTEMAKKPEAEKKPAAKSQANDVAAPKGKEDSRGKDAAKGKDEKKTDAKKTDAKKTEKK